MKITYRECDGCGERTAWIEALPRGWGELRIAGGEKLLELCSVCLAPIQADVRKRKKS